MKGVCDVAIAGGGPAGASLALQLSLMGVDVHLFEEHPSLGSPAHCAGLVGSGMESLPEIGRLVRLCTMNKIRGAVFVSPDGTRFSVEGKPGSALVLDRRLFDWRLGQEAAKHGATIDLGSRVTMIGQGEMAVTAGGSEKKFQSRVVVGATGSRFAIASLLGDRTGNLIPGIQFEVTKLSIDEEMVHIYFGKEISDDLFCWVIPVDSSTARIGLCCRRRARSRLSKFLQTRLSRDFGPGKVVAVNAGAIAYGIRKRTVWGNILLVGDEALQTKPTTGGGIHYSLICSEIASRCIAAHLSLGRDLRAYESAWRRKLEGEVRFGLMVRKLFERLSDSDINRLFAAISPRDSQLLAQADFDRHSTIARALPRLLPGMARKLGIARVLALSARMLSP